MHRVIYDVRKVRFLHLALDREQTVQFVQEHDVTVAESLEINAGHTVKCRKSLQISEPVYMSI